MGLSVSTSTGKQNLLENSEVLRGTALKILSKGGSSETAQKVIDSIWQDTDKQLKEIYTNSQINALKASTQISINGTLKETLKYLKTQAAVKVKKEPVLGEIWELFSATNTDEQNSYKGELFDFEIDKNVKNIFAA